MENNPGYWKDLYFKVYSENRQLRIELETLQKAYTELKVKYKATRSPKINVVSSSSTKDVAKAMKIAHSVDLQHIQTMTKTIIAPGYEVNKKPEIDLKNSFRLLSQESFKKTQVEVEEKVVPCIEEDLNPDLSLFEEIFILSVSSNFKSASVIGRYPNSIDM